MSCQAPSIRLPKHSEGLSFETCTVCQDRGPCKQCVSSCSEQLSPCSYVDAPGFCSLRRICPPMHLQSIRQVAEWRQASLRCSKRCTHVDDVPVWFRLIFWSQRLMRKPFERLILTTCTSGRLAAASLLQSMNGAAVFAARVCRSSRVSTSSQGRNKPSHAHGSKS